MSKIFIVSIILSIWSIILFWGQNLGLSVTLFIIPSTCYLIHILGKNQKIKNKTAKLYIIPITLLSLTYGIFNNEIFSKLNIFIIIGLYTLMIIRLLGESINLDTIVEKVIEIIFEPIGKVRETLRILKEEIKSKLKIKTNEEKTKKSKNVIKAIFITLLMLIIIIALLASADEIFANIFSNIFKNIIKTISKIKITKFIGKLIVTILMTLYLASFINNLITRKEEIKQKNNKTDNTEPKDNLTIKMILGALNIVYVLFSIIQIKSLFIGTITNSDFNYAGYARQGFFQLMLVSLINFVTIIIAKRNENKEETKSNKYINIMCLIMIILTFIIVVSAALRMYYYESEYGYTFLRLMVYWILLTEAILLIPTIMYVLDRKIQLFKVYFEIMLIMYICINFINIDSLIAKRNIDRYIETGKIDFYYLKSETSVDAVNQITRLLELNQDEKNVKEQAKKYLTSMYEEINNEGITLGNLNLSKIISKNKLEDKLKVKAEDENQSSSNKEEEYKIFGECKYKHFNPISENNNVSQFDYSKNMKYINKVYYKQINTYAEYLELKLVWNDILDMNEKDFENSFMIVTTIENTSMLGLTVDNIETIGDTLYINLKKYSDTEKYDENKTAISYVLPNKLKKDNIIIGKDIEEQIQDEKERISIQKDNYSNNEKLTEYQATLMAKAYAQELSKEIPMRSYLDKYTEVYSVKETTCNPNNFWDITDGIIERQLKIKDYEKQVYEVALVSVDDEVQVERAFFYVDVYTGKIVAGREMGD